MGIMPCTPIAPLFASVAFAFVTLAAPAQTAGPCPTSPVADHGQSVGGKPLASPAATASTTLDGKSVVIRYNSPAMRCRTVMGGLVPYGKVWRTGANPATTLVTAAHLKIGTLDVPAGTYTIYSLPGASTWMLIVNKQTGQWGTVYNQDQDLGRTVMTANPLAKPQEVMSISFEHTHGRTTELHVKWEKTDEFVAVAAE